MLTEHVLIVWACLVGCTLCGVQCPGHSVYTAGSKTRPHVDVWWSAWVHAARCGKPLVCNELFALNQFAQTLDQRSRPTMVAHLCARARCTLVVLALTVSLGAAQGRGASWCYRHRFWYCRHRFECFCTNTSLMAVAKKSLATSVMRTCFQIHVPRLLAVQTRFMVHTS